MPIPTENNNKNPEEEIKLTSYKLFTENLLAGNEKAALQALDNFIEKYGPESFHHLRQQERFSSKIPSVNRTYDKSLLYIAVENELVEVAAKLIHYGVPIDEGTSGFDNEYNRITPLMKAVTSQSRAKELVTLLLEHHASLLAQDGLGRSVLFYCRRNDLRDLLLTKAQETGCYAKLCAIRSKTWTVLEKACLEEDVEMLRDLLKVIEDWYFQGDPEARAVMASSLSLARTAYFMSPSKSTELDKICLSLRKLLAPAKQVKEFVTDAYSLDVDAAYVYLFGPKAFKKNIPTSKGVAVKLAIAQFHSLLKTPRNCIPYLKLANKEFLDHYQTTRAQQFPGLDHETNPFYFRIIDQVRYPIPSPDYKGFHRGQALQEFLIWKFMPYDIALDKTIHQWLGFNDKELGNEMVKEKFVVEASILMGLLHGPLAHMLQNLILIYAIKKGEINLAYVENGEKEITVKDILHGLVTLLKYPSRVEGVWNAVRDRRDNEKIVFSDPNRFVSEVMYNREGWEIKALGDYLIDMCCKGFKSNLAVLNKVPEFANMTMDEFVEKLNDINSTKFFLPTYFFQWVLEEAAAKGAMVTHKTPTGAIISKSGFKLFDHPAINKEEPDSYMMQTRQYQQKI